MSKAPKSADELLEIIKAGAAKRGQYLNPDEAFIKELADGLYSNLRRYGYASCPCRLSANNYEADRDILCPCVYMKDDVEKYGMCFCCLYVSKDVFEGLKECRSIPESRPKEKTFSSLSVKKDAVSAVEWKCCVCGYKYEGKEAPDKCPVCAAGREAFSKNAD